MRYAKKWESNAEYNMTQDEKDLLLKDLCARLPYKVKVQDTYYKSLEPNPIWLLDLNAQSVRMFADEGYQRIEYIKPYLFPISSMTVEQRCKAQNLLPNKCEISFINSKITFYGEDCCDIKLEQFDKLFKFFDSQHVDYRGLIPMGLAIDATGKNIY